MNLAIDLEVVKGPARGKLFHLVLAPGESRLVGRQREADVWLPQQRVSRRHCTLANRDGTLEVTDLGGLGTTLVNGREVRGTFELPPDGVLVVGPFHLRVTVHPEGSSFYDPERPGADLDRTEVLDPVLADTHRALPAVSMGVSMGPWELMYSLGEGGSSEVFRARHSADGRIVAVKVMKAPRSPRSSRLERFRREAELLAGLDHPHILKVIEAGTEGEQSYLVTELLEGQALASLLDKRPVLAGGLALSIARQVADALAYAAERKIIHRDVNPRNIFVLRGEGPAPAQAASVKLIDFGLGKDLAQGGLTVLGEGLGTLPYMAPEQIERARDADWRSDIYGLGATLYRMLSGRAPREARTPEELVRTLASPVSPLSVLSPGLPRAVHELVARCLAPEPRDRYRAYPELQRDLARAWRECEADGAR